MVHRIAQLSDLHLTGSGHEAERRSSVWASYQRVLERVSDEGPFDRVVLTGDLANGRRPETYARLRESLATILDRTRILPGNHDSRRRVRETFADRVVEGRDSVNFVDRLVGLRLIGLDSWRPWRVSGKLGTEQRDWLQGVLQEGDDPVFLFLHHPVFRVGCWWLDKDILRDAADLAAIVRGSSVRAIFFGHVHQECVGEFAGVPAFATPSTAWQFRPKAIRPAATCPGEPAFRIIEVDADRGLETRVVRLEGESSGRMTSE